MISHPLVGAAGFEPATSWSQTRRDDRTTLHPEKDCPRLNRRQFLILWRIPTFPHFIAVSSAEWGLTSLFGMGRGEHPPYNHHQAFGLILCLNK